MEVEKKTKIYGSKQATIISLAQNLAIHAKFNHAML